MPPPTGERVDGWLVIDKPVGPTSGRIVATVKRGTGARKAGHGGTLDPLASGVLPVALGEATKTVSFVMNGTKLYRFAVRWGEARATDDSEGAVTQRSEVRPTRREIQRILSEFTGNIDQVPPAFSALKVGGKRAYALARAGQPPDLAPRQVQIERLSLLEGGDSETTWLEVECGKGMFVRGLARDLATRLGTVGHVAALRRLRAGPFGENQAISIENLDLLGHSRGLVGRLLPLVAALADIPALNIGGGDAERLRSGQFVHVPDIERGTVCIMTAGRPVALARVDGGVAWPERVFNL